jgi:SAM-dependent methyltransferase
VAGDLLEVDFDGPYDGAYCLGNSFGYFEDAAMAAFCAKVASALRPGGRFLVNTAMAAESLLPDFHPREWMTIEDITLLLENRYDAGRSALETHYTFIRDGRMEKRSSEHFVHTVAGLKRLLRDSGFEVLETWGSTERTPFEFKDAQLYILAGKP